MPPAMPPFRLEVGEVQTARERAAALADSAAVRDVAARAQAGDELDAECLMCGMRRTNDELVRETADAPAAEAQLDILYRRGLRGVALLTGEYHHGPYRRTMIARTAEALRAALARGFTHVLVNIGALDAPEYETLLAGVPRRSDGRVVPRVTM